MHSYHYNQTECKWTHINSTQRYDVSIQKWRLKAAFFGVFLREKAIRHQLQVSMLEKRIAALEEVTL